MSEGLAEVLQRVGTQVTIEALEADGRTNASSHRPWEEYYDDALLALVKDRDALIFDRFDY